MNRIFRKLLICILIALMINNFVIGNFVFASGAGDALGDFLTDLLGSVVGLLTYPLKLVALAAGYAMNSVTALVAYSQGSIDDQGNITTDISFLITPFDIFFNKVALLDVNFFNIPGDGSVISNIRSAVAGWYYVMRAIAAAILLCVLIYVGIRMAISTIASDKAAYKKMLVDWVCSLALIFLLQYIMIFTFSVNEAFIGALAEVGENADSLNDAMYNIAKMALQLNINSIAATVVFCMLVAQTLGLVFSYFNRMLKIAFLMIIAPLITLTYSIDKMGDGKAQALGTWLKEFVYTVLLQTFHCIIYMAFISIALSIFTDPAATDENNIAGAIIAMLCIKFTKEGEKILGKIFKFSESTSDASLGVGMAASALALSKAKSIGKGTRSAINGVKNLDIGNRIRTAKVEALAIGSMLSGKTNEDGTKMTWAEAKEDANTNVTEKEADKAEKKNEKKYKVKSGNEKYQAEVTKKAKELMDKTGMTEKLALQTARKQIAQNTRREAKDSKHPKIAKARGTIGKVKEAKRLISNSETGKAIKSIVNSQVSAGLGTFAGSATYGATGDFFKSAALGMAAYKGSQEFLKSSTNTLKSEAKDLCIGLGATNSAQADEMTATVIAMAPILGNDQELSNQINEFLKRIDKELESLSKNDRGLVKTSIRNTVAKELKNDPSISSNKLLGKVQNAINANDSISNDAKNKVTTSDTLKGVVGQVGTIQRQKNLFDVIQNASNLGLEAGTFSNMVSSSFDTYTARPDDTRFKSNEEIINNVSTNGYTITEEDIKQRTEEGVAQVMSKLETNFNISNTTIDYDTMSDREIGIEVDRQKNIANNLQILNDRKLDETINRYQNEYDKLKGELEKAANQQVADEVKKKIDELKKQYSDEVSKFNGDRQCSSRTFGGEGEKIGIVSTAAMKRAEGLKIEVPNP